jgi:hypothetical protein
VADSPLKVETRVRTPLGLPAETKDLRRRLHPSQGADTGLGHGHEPRSRGPGECQQPNLVPHLSRERTGNVTKGTRTTRSGTERADADGRRMRRNERSGLTAFAPLAPVRPSSVRTARRPSTASGKDSLRDPQVRTSRLRSRDDPPASAGFALRSARVAAAVSYICGMKPSCIIMPAMSG